MSNKDSIDFGAIFREYDRRLAEAREKSDKLPKGLCVGKLLNFSVADGYAWYKVTKVGKRMTTLEWQDLHPDKYYEFIIGIKGSIPTEKVRSMIEMQESLTKIYGRSK